MGPRNLGPNHRNRAFDHGRDIVPAMSNEYQVRLNFGLDWWNAIGHEITLRWTGAASNWPLNQPWPDLSGWSRQFR